MMELATLVFLSFLQMTLSDNFTYTTHYYQQKLDHFNFIRNATFSQKYLMSDKHWKAASPIFFYTGNEGDIETFCNNTGLMWELAPEYHALLVFAEHRYYGSSLPFGNKSFSSPEHVGYLSSEQALADYAELIHYLKHSLKGAEHSPVIAFGGSYGGMLAAWLRLKYPHIVTGAIAASAPVAQFTGVTPCDTFSKIVTKDFLSVAPHCAQNIRRSWQDLRNIGKSAKTRAWLSRTWKLCKPLKTESDVKQVMDWLVDVYGNLAMMNYPYPTNFMADLPGFPVRHFCKYLDQPQLKGRTLLWELFRSLNIYFNHTGKATCLNYSDDDSSNVGWDYQSCTEMVMPMCSNGKTDMFDVTPWNFDNFAAGCKKRWGVTPRQDMAVIMYGGRDLRSASNIVLSNGLLDPWSGGGILKNVSSTVISVIIPDGAHHYDLRSYDPNDCAPVIKARNIERKVLWQWIHEYKP